MNSVTLTGTLLRKPWTSGKVAKFAIEADGKKLFDSTISFDNDVINAANHLNEGDTVELTGTVGVLKDKDKENTYKTYAIINKVKSAGNQSPAPVSAPKDYAPDDDLPF